MIRCTNCNTINPSDALFCSNCNSFLEWTGVPATPDEIAATKSGKAPATTADSATAQAAAEPQAGSGTAEAEAEPEHDAAPPAIPEALPEPLPEPAAGAEPEPALEAAASPLEPVTAAATEPAMAAQPEPAIAASSEPVIAAQPASIAPEPEPAPPAQQSSPAPTPPVIGASATILRPLPAPPPPPPPPPFRSMAAATPPPTLAPAPEPAKPEPPPEPVPDTESLVKPAPEPVKESFRYRAAPARRREESTASTSPSVAAAATPPTVEQPAARRPGFIAQVKHAVGMDTEETGSAGAPAAGQLAASTSAAPVTATDTAAQPQVKPDEPPAVRPQASEPAAVRPQATHLSAGQQPAAVKPAAQQIRRPTQQQKPPDEPEYNPGDLICGNCGAGNDPARRFCRRCGTSLAMAIVAQKPPWYRRIFRRRQRTLMAGERPKWMGDKERGRRFNWLHSMLRFQRMFAAFAAIVALGGVSAYAFLPNVHQQVDQGISQVRKMLMPSYQPITPTSFTAPSLTDHPIALAFDQYSNTYWAANRSGSPTLTVSFARPFDLGAIAFQTSPADKFAQFDRPKTVLLSFPGTNDAPITLNLKDDKAPIVSQGLSASGIQTIAISFTDYYPADQTGQDVLALCDIQIQERR